MTDWSDESQLVERLRRGDDEAFSEVIDRLGRPMIDFASVFVGDDDLAEELAQETWMAVIDGIDDFEGRSSLKTWVFAILSNRARRRANRDKRMRPWSSIFDESIESALSKHAERFDQNGRWAQPPGQWSIDPEENLMKRDLLEVIRDTLGELPESQRAVVRLRDVEGLSAAQTCDVLDISDGNQRVLLHRGRVKLRDAVEQYFESTETSS